jgi:hypothetical protein
MFVNVFSLRNPVSDVRDLVVFVIDVGGSFFGLFVGFQGLVSSSNCFYVSVFSYFLMNAETFWSHSFLASVISFSNCRHVSGHQYFVSNTESFWSDGPEPPVKLMVKAS